MVKKLQKMYWEAALKQWEGVGVIEIILILVIIIGLVLLFRNQIMDIITRAFESITNDSNSIIG